MNERQRHQAEQLHLLNLNIDWLITKYPLPPDDTEMHSNVRDLLSGLGISGETQVVVRAAAVLGDLAFASDDPKTSLARPEVIPNTVRTVKGALDLAQEMDVDIRLEINSALHYLSNVRDQNKEIDLGDSQLQTGYLDSTLNPAIRSLNEARQILP